VLTTITINNYALIDSLEIKFGNGFSVITGETGAGKSILLGAMSLLLGNRADVAVLKDKTKKCSIEGFFEISRYGLEKFFKKHDVDYFDTLIVRREISSAGRSRVFLNDTPSTLSVLKELSPMLSDIHSQHKNLELGNFSFQLKVTDDAAGTQKALLKYKKGFSEYKSKLSELEKLKLEAEKSKADFDYFQFRFNELEEANLQDGEVISLETELESLNHAEDIQKSLAECFSALQAEESGMLNQVQVGLLAIQNIERFYPPATDIFKRLKSLEIEISDLADEIETSVSDIDYNPQLIDQQTSRLDSLYVLMQKHNAKSDNELIEIKDSLESKLENINSYDEQISSLEVAVSKLKETISAQAEKISNARQKTFPKIQKEITSLLSRLGMPDAKFIIQRSVTENLTADGCDNIQFLFSANKNIAPQEISNVASGGEISRLMLSIKFLISKSTALPTIIFDEIDTGVSGDIADKMGDIMKLMSENMQVIDITHLPQIAAKADTHYMVYKQKSKDAVSSNIRILSDEERLTEIAKMLSGENITTAAIENAKVLLG